MEWTIGEAQVVIGSWSAKTFPKSTAESAVLHLWQEAVELRAAVRGREHPSAIAEEMADIFHLLVHLARIYGIDLQDAVIAKYQKNLRRKWLPPDEQGVVYHDPSEAP